MKRFKHISMLLAFAAVLSLVGCTKDRTSDVGGVSGGDNDGKFLYVTAGIALPSDGTRSGTDDTVNGTKDTGNDQTNSDGKDSDGKEFPDYEYAFDYENDVRSMILVFATTDDKYIAHTIVSGITQAPMNDTRFDFTVNGEIKYETLQDAYGNNGLLSTPDENGDIKVKIYVYCNYTQRLLDLFSQEGLSGTTEWLDWSGRVEEKPSMVNQSTEIANTIWAKRSFLMTNATEAIAFEFPKKLEDWDPYADKDHPYKLCNEGPDQTTTSALTPIKVERAAARFDFKDGSINKDQIYKLEAPTEKQADGTYAKKNLFSVKLTRMALVNMSKEFYYLRRVSKDGKNEPGSNNANELKIGGAENRSNYVVDIDYATKLLADGDGYNPGNAEDGVTGDDGAIGGFNFALFESTPTTTNGNDYAYNPTAWYADNIKKVLDGADDNWTEGTGNSKTTDYKIWRYVTENTIPSIEQQKTVQSTGIVFKGAIIAGTDIAAIYSSDNSSVVSKKVQLALTAAGKHLKQTEDVENWKDVEAITDDMTEYNYPILYSFGNWLYAGIDDLVYQAVKDGPGGTLYMAMGRLLKDWYLSYTDETEPKEGTFTYYETAPTNGTNVKYKQLTLPLLNWILNEDLIKAEESDKDDTDDMETEYAEYSDTKYAFEANVAFETLAASKEGFTIYRAENEDSGLESDNGWGYYCYYFYWNRHNDNLNPGRMGQMEFATVRNNVYKLAVTEIGKLGHPRNTKDDPDPVDPEDPDEDTTNYIQVKVEVLPWVVRVNNIKF